MIESCAVKTCDNCDFPNSSCSLHGRTRTRKTALTICIEDSFWAPNTFVVDGVEAGVHVEISKQALSNLGITFKMPATSWNRCIEGGKSGYYDGVLSASYDHAREVYFYFPPDAGVATISKWRVTANNAVAVVRAEDFKEWDGKEENLPKPIGMPLGYSMEKLFRAKGLPVVSSHKYSDLLHMLLKGRISSTLMPLSTAEFYMSEYDNWKYLRILETPFRVDSYFLLLSKKGKANWQTATDIWNEIAKLREDKAFRREITVKVDKQLDYCFRSPPNCNY